jgi:hypothetical protein
MLTERNAKRGALKPSSGRKQHTPKVPVKKYNSPALPGRPLSLSAFRKWIAEAEAAPTVSLEEVERLWKAEKKKLKRLMK